MSNQFNLFPRVPQNSYYPNSKNDSTLNGYYEHKLGNGSVMNQYNIVKSSGNPYNTEYGVPFSFEKGTSQSIGYNGSNAEFGGNWVFDGFWLTGGSSTTPNGTGKLNNKRAPVLNYSSLSLPVDVDVIGYQRGGSYHNAFYLLFKPGALDPSANINSISSIALYNDSGEKVREYTTSGADPTQFGVSSGAYYWWWPASDNPGNGTYTSPLTAYPTNSQYTGSQEVAFWSSNTGRLSISWNGLPSQTGVDSLKKSTPIIEKQGSSDTYNNGTGSRLLRLKSNAIMNSK